jgi:hypothetical protein
MRSSRRSVLTRRATDGTSRRYVNATSALLITASAGEPFASADVHTARPAAHRVDIDPARFRFEPDLAAEILKEPNQCIDERAGPAHREPHAPFLLEDVDERVDR